MIEYLMVGALLALLVLWWLVRGRQRRSASRDSGPQSTSFAPGRPRAKRAASRLDSALSTLFPPAADLEAEAQRAQREAAEEAARIEGDREAAEWEARLVAEQLARMDEERARLAAERDAEAATPAPRAVDAEAVVERSEREALESLERSYAEAQTQPGRPQVDERPAPAAPPAPHSAVVMVADASKVVRVKTSRLLEQHGWRSVQATDGLQVLEQIGVAAPQALITGTELSGLDGLALTRRLRADERTAQLPIVMISADHDALREVALAAGVSLLLGKPYAPDELIDYLASIRQTAAQG